MTKNLFHGIIFVISVLTLAICGCNIKTDNPLAKEDFTTTVNIPSSSYPVDIIGQVIIAQSVIADGKEHKMNGEEYWIIQTSIRNKSYQTTINSHVLWNIGKKSNPNYHAGGLIMNTGQQIEQGKSGTVTLCFMVSAVGLNPNDHQLCLFGWAKNVNNKIVQIPDSYGPLIDTKAIAETYDWNSQKIIKMSSNTPRTTTSGTSIESVRQSMTNWINGFINFILTILLPLAILIVLAIVICKSWRFRRGKDEGYIYIMRNSKYKRDLYKIGKSQNPDERAKQMSSTTGVAGQFEVLFRLKVHDMDLAESQVHAELECYRVQNNREFFVGPIDIFIDAVKKYKN